MQNSKQLVFVFLFSLCFFLVHAQQPASPTTVDPTEIAAKKQQVEPEVSEIFQVVEQMPEYKGCEAIKDRKERHSCAKAKMLEFVYQNLYYPEEAKAQGVEGVVVIRFIVEKDGSLSHAQILRDPGAGLGEAALDVVKQMPDWNPGRQRNQPVRVYFNLPVKFKLAKKK